MTIASKLLTIKNSIQNIKSALQNMGVSPQGDITTYANAIQSIETSQASQNSPLLFAGLHTWLDGQYNNFLYGKNHLDRYMENNIGSGSRYKIVNNGTWNGDFLQLSDKNFYESPDAPITFEAVFKISQYATNQHSIWHYYYVHGYFVNITPEGYIYVGIYDSQTSSILGLYSNQAIQLNKAYHIVFIIDETTKKMKLSITNLNDNNEISYTSYDPFGNNAYYAGLGNTVYNSYASNGGSITIRNEGLQIGMIRIWNRALSNDEILSAYNECKDRFNIS